MSGHDLERPSITIERTYRVSPRELWELWTTRAGFESWWGPVGFRGDVHTLEPEVGGSLRYDMVADHPQMIEAMLEAGQPVSHPVDARFSEVTPLSRLAIRSVIDFLPGVEPYESEIGVDFVPLEGGVRMVITLSPMHDEATSRMQAEGMTSQLGKLDARYA